MNKTQDETLLERAESPQMSNPARSDREKMFMMAVTLKQRCCGWCQTGFVSSKSCSNIHWLLVDISDNSRVWTSLIISSCASGQSGQRPRGAFDP